MSEENKVVRLESVRGAFRDSFLGWQCRIRQLCVRESGGRPTPGMRPRLTIGDDAEAIGTIVVILVKRESAESTAQFRHMIRRTHDPRERLEAALRYLSASYYQHAREFSGQLTALFGPDSDIGDRLIRCGRCRLDFEHNRQSYRLPCAVEKLNEADAAYQATYWHNSLFNPKIPSGVSILGFRPDWAHAVAEPPVN